MYAGVPEEWKRRGCREQFDIDYRDVSDDIVGIVEYR